MNTAGQTINEKNTVPSITKAVKEDSTGSFGESATIDVTDTIHYQLTVNTGTNSNSNGTGINDNYVITDALPTGITYNTGTVAIEGWTQNTDYTISEPSADNNNTLTITLLSSGKLADLGQNANIFITYNAEADDTLTVDTAYTNTVTLTYKNQTSTDTASVKTYDIKGDAAGNTFTKVEAGTEKPLAGVKFVLKNRTTSKLSLIHI